MKQTIYRFVSLPILLVMAVCLSVGCGPAEQPEPKPTPTPTPTTVAVTGVTLNKSTLSLVEGSSETLTATVAPSNADNKSISWKSSDSGIASVDNSGKVTAVKAGSATVTVTTADGGKTASCAVTVTEAPKIVITGNTAKVPVSGGTAEFAIQYNTTYTIDIEQSAKEWLHFVETRAMQSGTLVFSVDANPGEARTGKATVKDNEGKVDPITLTFEQEAKSEEDDIRAALMQIYNAMDGPNWKNAANWGSDSSISVWQGVEWNKETKELKLRFQNNGLKGEFPDCIGDLGDALVRFDVSSEPGVTGSLPEAFNKLTGLKALTIRETSMTSLPDVFSGLTQLEEVTIIDNASMTGTLPPSIGEADGLASLRLQNNSFTGGIPDSWADLGYRKVQFFVYGNRLSGSLPKGLFESGFYSGDVAAILWQQDGYGLDITDAEIPGGSFWPAEAVTDIISGARFAFPDIIGKNEYTVFLVWSLWDPYSTTLVPALKSYYKDYHDKGLEVIATVMHNNDVSLFDNPDEQKAEILKKGYDCWYNYYYRDSGSTSTLMSVPNAEVYDRNGNIVFSSFSSFPDPVRNRFGRSASNELISFLESVLGPEGFGYASTDYSKDGDVMTLQKASVGNGINLVLMGDAYTDKDMASGGLYETVMRQAMEEYFSIEPYKTFQNRFNVYAVKAVSPNGRVGEGSKTALGTVYIDNLKVNCDYDKCFEYAAKIPGLSLDNLTVAVLVNTWRNQGTCQFFANGPHQTSVAITSTQGNDPSLFGPVLRHETGGHGFGFLDDEYATTEEAAPQYFIEQRTESYNKYGWYANVDFTNDPAKVKWSAFLADDRYKDEVGIFEGGGTYGKGVYRPSEDSMMRYDDEYFNAPSRWAIYKRIMEVSGETASFEKFLEYDAVNRGKKATHSASRARSSEKGHLGALSTVVR